MPYIKDQEKFDKWLAQIPQNLEAGELNYIITKILLSTNPAKYKDFNGLMGVLACVKSEFYRRVVAPYEDKKIEENGDVF